MFGQRRCPSPGRNCSAPRYCASSIGPSRRRSYPGKAGRSAPRRQNLFRPDALRVRGWTRSAASQSPPPRSGAPRLEVGHCTSLPRCVRAPGTREAREKIGDRAPLWGAMFGRARALRSTSAAARKQGVLRQWSTFPGSPTSGGSRGRAKQRDASSCPALLGAKLRAALGSRRPTAPQDRRSGNQGAGLPPRQALGKTGGER